jgi:hypothetical protein
MSDIRLNDEDESLAQTKMAREDFAETECFIDTTVDTINESTSLAPHKTKTSTKNSDRSATTVVVSSHHLLEPSGGAAATADVDNISLRNESTFMCRICHSNDLKKELIAPCNCSGTLKYVHQACLQHWLKTTGKMKGERSGFILESLGASAK